MVVYERTFVVVIDDAHARFFRRSNSGELAESLPGIALATGPRATPEANRQARLRFLNSVIDALGQACDTAQFERLVVVAPERMLRLFRNKASDKIRARQWRESAHETGGTTADDIKMLIEPYFIGVHER